MTPYQFRFYFIIAILMGIFLEQKLVLSSVSITSPIRIGCGGTEVVQDAEDRVLYDKDQWYLGGTAHTISSQNLTFQRQPELLSLRAFHLDSTPCYHIPLPYGRYVIRLRMLYGNYDGLSKVPSFLVVLAGAVVDNIGPQNLFPDSPRISDYEVYANQTLSLCFQPILGDPFVNSIEILPADTRSFAVHGLLTTDILRTLFRVNSGGPAIPQLEDPQYRTWMADVRDVLSKNITVLPNVTISGAAVARDYLPRNLFLYARTTNGTANSTGYSLQLTPVGTNNTFLVRCHFAEISSESVLKSYRRVMNVLVRSPGLNFSMNLVQNLDLMQAVGRNKVYSVGAIFSLPENPKSNLAQFSIVVEKASLSTLDPLLSGVDIYEVIDASQANVTQTEQDLTRRPRVSLKPKGNKESYSVAVIITIVLVVLAVLSLLIVVVVYIVKNRKDLHPPESTPSYLARVNSLAVLFPSRSRSSNSAAQEETGPIRAPYERSSEGVFRE